MVAVLNISHLLE
jgi:hypothetical protein